MRTMRSKIATPPVLALRTLATALALSLALGGCEALPDLERRGTENERGGPATSTPDERGDSDTLMRPSDETTSGDTTAGPLPNEGPGSVTYAAARVLPSVVNVGIRRRVDDPLREEQGQDIQTGVGSGVVISTQGHILTNNHVVEGSDEIVVAVGDRDLPARIIGRDERTDLAVIRVDSPNLEPAEIGTSEDLRVGEWVIAAGSPFGFDKTVTAGIISATDRNTIEGSTQFEGPSALVNLIQTDASINPGNSGGALADLNGRVIGINTAIISPSGASGTPQSAGIGFAIPIDFAMRVARQLIDTGRVVHPVIGVEVATLTPALAQQLDLPVDSGVLVRGVTSGSPAEEAGIREGDVIVRLDGDSVESVPELLAAISEQEIGSEVEVTIVRGDERRTLPVRIGSDR